MLLWLTLATAPLWAAARALPAALQRTLLRGAARAFHAPLQFLQVCLQLAPLVAHALHLRKAHALGALLLRAAGTRE